MSGNNKIELQISAMAPSGSTTGAYAMVLSEVDGVRKLPIVIGNAEAQAIAIELEQMMPSRPLTHDLFRSLARAYAIDVEEVLIYNLADGIFFSKLVTSMDGRTAEIDARTSDAVAIAVRFNCPIYCYESILDIAGVNTDDSLEEESAASEGTGLSKTSSEEDTESMTMEELQRQLDDALSQEDYEMASKIRDEMKKRKDPF